MGLIRPAATLAFMVLVPGAWAAPIAHVVTIDGMRFQPDTLVVRPGERVTWSNKDLVPHTATHREFDSGNIKANASWSFVPKRPGTYHYLCTYHPTMKGVLIVQESTEKKGHAR